MEDAEVAAASGLGLFLRLDPSCFLYYVTACDKGDQNEHVERVIVIDTKNPTKETVHSLLADAENGVSFILTRPIRKGEKLLHHFPSQASILVERMKIAQGGNVVEGGVVSSPGGRQTRASTRATAAMDTTS